MLLPKSSKVQYSETEAAALLGISVEHLRDLVRRHIVKDEGDSSNLANATFQASDLLVLKILAGVRPEHSASTSAGF